MEISIFCTFKGYPLPKIIWYHDTLKIRGCFKTKSQNCKNSRFIVEQREERWDVVHAHLKIMNSLYSDSGTYLCQALNAQGDVSSDISVTVESKYFN